MWYWVENIHSVGYTMHGWSSNSKLRRIRLKNLLNKQNPKQFLWQWIQLGSKSSRSNELNYFWSVTSGTKKNVPRAVVIYHCAWYVFLRDRRYVLWSTAQKLEFLWRKVSKFQNEFLKSSFVPKYDRNPYNFSFIFWEKWKLHKFIHKFTDL